MKSEINSFAEMDFDEYARRLNLTIKNEIEQQGKDYILQVDETEYKQHLYNEFALEELEIFKESEKTIPNTYKETRRNPRTGRSYEEDVYSFVIKYSFLGTAELFHLRPSTFKMIYNTIFVDPTQNKVSFNFKMTRTDKEQFNKMKQQGFDHSFSNLDNINEEVKKWNNNLLNYISNQFDQIKNKYKKENDFFAEINAEIDPNTKSLFSVPTIEKIIVPKPEICQNKKHHSYPTMSNEMYADVLDTLYTAGTGMERKPSLYVGKEEEDLRDLFLFHLELRYKSVTATGETFNRNGKTDILLKYSEDGSNLFVAECKFWHGPNEFHKAIDQLFDNYLTWRDSKAALIIFVKNRSFTKVLSKIKEKIKTHKLFIKSGTDHRESSFSYVMSLPQDEEKEVFLEVLVFHFDK